jgi:hypothetical protein
VPDLNDTNSYELGTRFSFNTSGFVCGVRFYKGAGNTGTHVGKLWNGNTGQLLASATFTNETASGWQSVNFATPVAVQAATWYILSYSDAGGHLSYDANYFASQGQSNGSINAPSAASGNGVYAFGAGNYPASGSPTGNNF